MHDVDKKVNFPSFQSHVDEEREERQDRAVVNRCPGEKRLQGAGGLLFQCDGLIDFSLEDDLVILTSLALDDDRLLDNNLDLIINDLIVWPFQVGYYERRHVNSK
ncbi:hypothetical protein HYQ46_002266 [Verticillium longisporum]|nr:hypothetical protein HYQ46_002266 [Verticillium longisporum]